MQDTLFRVHQFWVVYHQILGPTHLDLQAIMFYLIKDTYLDPFNWIKLLWDDEN